MKPHPFYVDKAEALIANQVNRTLRDMRDCPIKRVEVRQDMHVEALANLGAILFGIELTINYACEVSIADSREHVHFVNLINRLYDLKNAVENLRANINSGNLTI